MLDIPGKVIRDFIGGKRGWYKEEGNDGCIQCRQTYPLLNKSLLFAIIKNQHKAWLTRRKQWAIFCVIYLLALLLLVLFLQSSIMAASYMQSFLHAYMFGLSLSNRLTNSISETTVAKITKSVDYNLHIRMQFTRIFTDI